MEYPLGECKNCLGLAIKIEQLQDALEKILEWSEVVTTSNGFPEPNFEKVKELLLGGKQPSLCCDSLVVTTGNGFPEPNWEKVRELLLVGGITSAGAVAFNVRNVIKSIESIAKESLGKEEIKP